MIRKTEQRDRTVFLEMQDEFYHSSAVLQPIPAAHAAKTFAECVQGNPYVEAYVFEEADGIAGYALLALTYSNEAGGVVVWLEELYIRRQFQGRGIGSSFFRFLESEYAGRAARLRLEVDADNAGAIALYKRLGFEAFPYLQFVRELDG